MSEHRSLRAQLAAATPLGRQDGRAPVNIAFLLPLKNEADLPALLHRIYDPSDPLYHHFLTPEQFAASFGSDPSAAQDVAQYAQSMGLTVTYASPAGNLIVASGSSADVERSFGVRFNRYLKANGRSVYAADRAPQIPDAIASRLVGVAGFDNVAERHGNAAASDPNDVVAAARQGVARAPSAGTGPAGAYSPSDIKTAYGLSGTYNGTGQTAALVEFDGYNASDITAYANYFGLGAPAIQNVLLNGFNGVPATSGGQMECTLDIDMLLAMAPRLKALYVYEAPNNSAGTLAILSRIASDNKASVISTSWGIAEDLISPMEAQSENQSFLQMAAQGQTFCAASGDSGAYGDAAFYSYDPTVVVEDPASQPLVLGVGGTVIGTSNRQWVSEKVWTGTLANAANNGGGSGGGISVFWAKPSYQAGDSSKGETPMGASPTMRDVPDVSLNAGPANCYSIYMPSAHIGSNGWFGMYGTSAASPIWAGFLALANQAAAAAGKPAMGFVNPSLYSIARAPLYAQTMHDIVSGNNLFYTAGLGFDDASGLGSFIGDPLLAALSGTPLSGGATPPPAPTGLKAAGANASVTLSWTRPSGTLTGYAVKRSTSSAGPFNTVLSNVATTSATDTGLQNGTTYYYVVTAVNSAGESPNSTKVSAMPWIPGQTPSAPTGVKATAGNAQVTVVWSAASGAKSYNVKRSTTSAGPYTLLATGMTSTKYVDKAVQNGATYYYVVSANNPYGQGADSAQVSAKPVLPAPYAPSSVVATASAGQIAITWKAPTNVSPVTYSVGRSLVSGGPYTIVVSGLAATSYLDNTATSGVTYHYVVYATNSAGTSPRSAQVNVVAL